MTMMVSSTLALCVLLMAIMGPSVSMARSVHVRIHTRHATPSRMSHHAKHQDHEDTQSTTTTITCPSTSSTNVTTTLSSDCPSVCGQYGMCVYYPAPFKASCRTTVDRTCYEGATCAYECYANLKLNGWFITIYTDERVVDQVNRMNNIFPGERSIAIDATTVKRLGTLTLTPNTFFFFLTGNEPANAYDRSDSTYTQDTTYFPAGEIVPFELAPTLFDDLANQTHVRIENLHVPTRSKQQPLALKSLQLINTGLTDFPFPIDTIPAITFMDLSVNLITAITPSSIPTQLTWLNLSANAISSIAKGSLPEGLVILDLANNKLVNIPPGTLPPQLSAVYLENNALTEIPADVAAMVYLNELYLGHNAIGVIPEGRIPPTYMDGIGLNNCSLTEIPHALKAMKNLTFLIIGDNDFSREPDFSRIPTSVQTLQMYNCKLPYVPKELLAFANLTSLNLNKNPLAATDLTFVPPQVVWVSLSSNGLKAMPHGLDDKTGLLGIELWDNPLVELVPGTLPPSLQAAYFSNARFEIIPANVFTNALNELVIQDSPLKQVPEDLLYTDALVNLTISGCQLTDFDNVTQMSWVVRLDLSGNRLTKFRGELADVEYLDLRNNSLRSMTITSAPNLRNLQLAYNNLTFIPSWVFDLQELQVLNLTSNPIEKFIPSVDQYAFLKRLQVLDMNPEMFAAECDELMPFRGYNICKPGQNITVINQENSFLKKGGVSAGLVVLNVFLILVLCGVLVAVWHRRRLHARRMEDLQLKNVTLEQRESTIWQDAVLLKHRLDSDLVVKDSLLGSGMYGEVWLATYKRETVALKHLRGDDTLDRDVIREFVEEIKLVSTFTHPRVVRFIGVVWSKESDVAMVTEYMPGGDLRSYLDTTEKPENGWDDSMVQIALDITEALVYLHSLEPVLIHRDLKSRNVLLDLEGRAKLSDFGISRYKMDEETMTACVGTIRWIAPEVLEGKRYDESVDIYSLGIILSEIDTHQLPFWDAKDDDNQNLTDSAIAGLVMAGKLTSSFSASCPSEILSLARRCMSRDPRKRPTGLHVAYQLRKLLRRDSLSHSDETASTAPTESEHGNNHEDDESGHPQQGVEKRSSVYF